MEQKENIHGLIHFTKTKYEKCGVHWFSECFSQIRYLKILQTMRHIPFTFATPDIVHHLCDYDVTKSLVFGKKQLIRSQTVSSL